MSIGPLPALPAEISSKLANAEAGAPSFPPRSGTGSSPAPGEEGTGTVPNQEDADSRESLKVDASPQDVVEVHQDSEVKDQLIVEYLDQARNVILQVPSDEELNVERGIAEELQQAAKQRINQAAVPSAREGDQNYGN